MDYDETFALVARMEAIKILIAFAAFMGFKLYEMNVKSAFFNAYPRRKCLSSNLLDLKMLIILTMCYNWTRHCIA